MNSTQAIELIKQGAELVVQSGTGAYYLVHSSFRNGMRKVSSVTGSAIMNKTGIRYATLRVI